MSNMKDVLCSWFKKNLLITLTSDLMRESISITETNSIRNDNKGISEKTFSHPVKGYTRHDDYSDSSPPRPPIFNIAKDDQREKETDGHPEQNEEEGQIDASGVDREGLAHRAVFRDFLHFVVRWMMFWDFDGFSAFLFGLVRFVGLM